MNCKKLNTFPKLPEVRLSRPEMPYPRVGFQPICPEHAENNCARYCFPTCMPSVPGKSLCSSVPFSLDPRSGSEAGYSVPDRDNIPIGSVENLRKRYIFQVVSPKNLCPLCPVPIRKSSTPPSRSFWPHDCKREKERDDISATYLLRVTGYRDGQHPVAYRRYIPVPGTEGRYSAVLC